MSKLGKEQIVAIKVLQQQGQKRSETARILGVTEGSVRHHLRQMACGKGDGRKGKKFLIEQLGLEAVVKEWWEAQTDGLTSQRPPNVEGLGAYLKSEHGYGGSYKSVRKYVRAKFPVPKMRPYRRVETPPGAQSQSDWGEFALDLGGTEGPEKVHAFVMVLSHSRKAAVIWSRSEDQLAWHRCHNEAYQRLGGVAATNRIDNVKTGIARGTGAWGKLNKQYAAYAKTMGFHIDACEGYSPEQKGKVERRIGIVRQIGVERRGFESMAHLQAWTDVRLPEMEQHRICPATGQSVVESWAAERPLLRALPENLPEPFDLVRTCPVHKDCSIRFEGRTYIVPFAYCRQEVEVRGCAGFLQIVDCSTGRIVMTYERGTAQRLLIEPRCYEGPETARVAAPKPLGRMARKLQEIMELPVQQRPLDLYAALAEVAR